MDGPIPARWAPYLLSVLRIVVAFLYIAHGTQKLFGFPTGEPPRPPVPLMSRAVHAAHRLHPRRRDGVRLFHRSRVARILAAAQPRRAPGVLLLHVAVLRGGGRGPVEPGRAAKTVAPERRASRLE